METIHQDPRLLAIASAQPYPLVFATVSGAHLYGFPSPNSDVDLRGVHVLPAREALGLHHRRDTLETMADPASGLDLDLVTHDLEKFMQLLLKPNGYVLEQLLSPLVVLTTPAHAEMVALVPQLVTRHHAHHYHGFASNQWRLFSKEEAPRVKPLLYTYRVLLTGIHLMRTGKVEANLEVLNETFRLPHIPELLHRKRTGEEKGVLPGADLAFHEAEFTRLLAELDEASATTSLPEAPTAKDALSDLLVRVRLGESK